VSEKLAILEIFIIYRITVGVIERGQSEVACLTSFTGLIDSTIFSVFFDIETSAIFSESLKIAYFAGIYFAVFITVEHAQVFVVFQGNTTQLIAQVITRLTLVAIIFIVRN
jgi:hypothetical protein